LAYSTPYSISFSGVYLQADLRIQICAQLGVRLKFLSAWAPKLEGFKADAEEKRAKTTQMAENFILNSRKRGLDRDAD
jgi:hypothetical protein